MYCANCFQSINSLQHITECDTIKMYQLKKQDMPLKKKMMTYGLAGCTAIIIIDREYNRILMGHHPEKNEVLKWFTQNYYSSSDYKYTIIIKLPGEYIENDLGKFDLKGREVKYWKNELPENPNLKIIFEPYNLNKTIHISVNKGSNFSYNSSLYFRQTDENNFEYSDKYGRWVRI